MEAGDERGVGIGGRAEGAGGGVRRVPEEMSATPLDGVVRALFQVPWSRARKWVADGKIAVDGVIAVDARLRPGAGAEIEHRPGARRPAAPGDLPAGAIVHLDAHVVVVDKPTGVSTMPYERGEHGTLDQLVRRRLSRMEPGGRRSGAHPALSVVHRLDKETSGLIVFARTYLARQRLKALFRTHEIDRRYLALAHGEVGRRTIRSRLLADRGDGRRGSAGEARFGREAGADEGRPSVTHIEPLERLAGATLVACRLETGRTHQIRIHLAEAGHPLLGERVYGRDVPGRRFEAPRVMLHAEELGFAHPATGEPVRWSRRPPADFWETLERLRR